MSEWIVTNMEFTDAWAETYGYKRLVRCKDCKYKHGSACEYSAVWVRPNGYCQYGERKDTANG